MARVLIDRQTNMNPAPEETDDDDLLRARGGDGIALGQLMDRHKDYMTTFVQLQLGRRMQSKVEASDVVQEAMLDAIRQFPAFRGTTEIEFTTWLRRILVGKVALTLRQYLGTQSRDIKLEQRLATGIDDSAQPGDVEVLTSLSTASMHAMRREESLLLAKALTKLPELYRAVVIHRSIENLSFREIAELLGKTENSVQKLWVRALTKLRGSLEAGT